MAALANLSSFPDACGHCTSRDVIVDTASGDVVCRSCGTVLLERLEVDDSVLRVDAHDTGMTRIRDRQLNSRGGLDTTANDDYRKRRKLADAGEDQGGTQTPRCLQDPPAGGDAVVEGGSRPRRGAPRGYSEGGQRGAGVFLNISANFEFGLTRGRCRAGEDPDDAAWGMDGATLDQLKKQTQIRNDRARAVGAACDALADRLTLPPPVSARARKLLRACSGPALDAAAAAARRRTAAKARAKKAQGDDQGGNQTSRRLRDERPRRGADADRPRTGRSRPRAAAPTRIVLWRIAAPTEFPAQATTPSRPRRL